MKFSVASIVTLVALASQALGADVLHCTSLPWTFFVNLTNELINVFSRRWARCTSLLIYGYDHLSLVLLPFVHSRT